MEQDELPCLLDLPDALVLHSLSFLPPRAVCSFGLASRQSHSLSQDAGLWRLLLRRHFDVLLTGNEVEAALSLFRRVMLTATASISFRGVYTDGGCDQPQQSIENLFADCESEAYCSQRGANVTCLALLLPPASEDTRAAERTEERARLLARCRIPALHLFGEPRARAPGPRHPSATPEPNLRYWSRSELCNLFLQLMDLAHQHNGLGLALFAELEPAEARAEAAACIRLAHSLQAERAAWNEEENRTPTANQLRWWSPLPLPLPPPGLPRALACVRRLRVSRAGQFSCPLSAGFVLLSQAVLPAEAAPAKAALLELLDGTHCRACDGLSELQSVLDASRAGRLPPVARTAETPAGRWLEFAPRGFSDSLPSIETAAGRAFAAQLWPVAWFCFTSRSEAVARAAAEPALVAEDPDFFDHLSMSLERSHAGCVAAVKLVSSENLMAEWSDEHAESNIDATSVVFEGHSVVIE
jgi:hypothetical protein